MTKSELNNSEFLFDLIERANALLLTEFVFTKDGKTYRCFWSKAQWSDPVEIHNFN